MLPILPFDPLFFRVASLLFGLVTGSFANVCIHRVPRGLSIVTPPSRCPACGAFIRYWQNIPLLSFFLLRGRCASCHERISWRYPLVEAANGSAYLAAAWIHGPSLDVIVLMALITALIVLSLVDLDHMILPDAITKPGIAAGLMASLLKGAPSPLDAGLSCLGGFFCFAALALAYQRLRGRDGLGRGDWKMAAMLGAFLGWEKLLLTVFTASVAGTIVGLSLVSLKTRTLRHPLPLGTFMGFAGVLVALFGERALDWYRALWLKVLFGV